MLQPVQETLPMSLLEIPFATWQSIYTDNVVWYLARGMDLLAARQSAREDMANCFTILETNLAEEHTVDLRRVWDE